MLAYFTSNCKSKVWVITNVNLSYKNMLYFGLNRRILEWAIDEFWGFDAILFVKIELRK